MAKKQGLGSVRRFGPRYGRTVKHKLAKIEAIQKGKHKCPYCAREGVKRLASGIWNCPKCSAKFAARAYAVGQPQATAGKSEQLIAEAEIEE